jgi:phosphoenolpyruvate synthase/pyruvate phosphate dikinase
VTDLRDPAEVGHKFSRLEEMRRAGFPVPSFCCLPAAAFDEALARALPQAGDPAAGDPAATAGRPAPGSG